MTVIPELELIENLAVWFLAIYPLIFASIGWFIANTFAKKTDGVSLDEYIESSGKFTGFSKWLLNKTLKSVHHYWLGAILAYVFNPWQPIANLPWLINEFLFYVFFGVFLEDGQYHLRKFIEHVQPVVNTT